MTMEDGCSKPVTSSQEGPHPHLLDHLERHRQHIFEKPVAEHNRQAFESVAAITREKSAPLLLDAGCGTGESTHSLAQKYPDHFVIGVDKSAHRLSKEDRAPLPENAVFVRADLIDFYRLAHEAGWQLSKHFILYPNPWPKPGHLMRRWHGSPVFPQMMALGGQIELRTNWRIYAEEFRIALEQFEIASTVETVEPQDDYLSLFERKYHLSNQKLYRVLSASKK